MSLFKRLSSHDDVTVTISELLVATADDSDPLVDGSVNEVLASLRQRLGMDVVFVSEFVEGRRIFRFVESGEGAPPLAAGASSPLEESFCQRVVDGRLPKLIQDASKLSEAPPVPFHVGGHLSTPIVLRTGKVYGTLCCFSGQASPSLRAKDLEALKMCALLVARKLDLADAAGLVEPPTTWSLEPQAVYESTVWRLP